MKMPSAFRKTNPIKPNFRRARQPDEILHREVFCSLRHAKVLARNWPLQYNHYRPHRSLNYMTTAAFAALRPEKQ
ncbi:MAG: integrase core domain-containing protein [Planctomycetota bacterium]|jgi:transposase InsO family protein